MKRFLFLIVLSGIFVISAMAQYVTLHGRQFKDEHGNDFYPVVCNYIVSIVNQEKNDFSSTFVSPEFAWGADSTGWDCSSTMSCNTQLEIDFKQLLSMGFNIVRLMGLGPIFIAEGTVVKSWKDTCDWICPYSGFYIFAPHNDSDCLNDKWFRLQSPFIDDTSQRLFEHIENILQVASATEYNGKKMKIILITGGGRGDYSLDFPNEYGEYLSVLGEKISSIGVDSVKGAIMAYDLFNEPTCSWDWESLWPSDSTGHSKQDVCKNVKDWYDSLKTHDPNHMITFGGKGMNDLFEFDPAILTVDFYSPHFYPTKRSFESSPGYYDKMMNRIKGEYYWLQNNLPMPWIIGETGFLAQNTFNYPEVDGTLSEQKDYADTTLSLVRQSNGSGYSWWIYQNVKWTGPSQDYYGIYDYGQCSPIPCHTTAKPVHQAFENFVPQPPGILSQPDHYFDPYDHEYYNPDTTKYVSGYVLDQYNAPIEGAFIKAYTRLHGYGSQSKLDDHYTFTDENGKFILIPYDYDTLEPNYNRIECVYISAPGGSRMISSCWECPNGISNNQTFILNKNELNYQENVVGLNILPNQKKILQAWDNITLQDVTIQSHGDFEVKARSEIIVNTELQAYDSSIVWIHISKSQIPCDSLSPNFYKSSSLIEPAFQEEIEPKKEICLKFMPLEKEFGFIIYPNPGNGVFKIEISDFPDNKDMFLTAFDQFGKKVFYSVVQSEIMLLDLSFLSKGIYIVKIENAEKVKCKKIIII
jgi:hypothetical protein